jgi:hypothetical protein
VVVLAAVVQPPLAGVPLPWQQWRSRRWRTLAAMRRLLLSGLSGLMSSRRLSPRKCCLGECSFLSDWFGVLFQLLLFSSLTFLGYLPLFCWLN